MTLNAYQRVARYLDQHGGRLTAAQSRRGNKKMRRAGAGSLGKSCGCCGRKAAWDVQLDSSGRCPFCGSNRDATHFNTQPFCPLRRTDSGS